MTFLLLSVPIAPLLAVLAALLGGERPVRAGWFAVMGMGTSLVALVPLAGSEARISGTWFRIGDLTLTAGLRLDGLSGWMAMLVTGVSLLVTLYAVAYMRDEEDQPRFFALMAFFVGAMLTLVLADSLVLLFMAWEGVGLASYGLIAFHFREDRARRAATKAFLLTRLGDFGLLLGWLGVLLLLRTTELTALLDTVEAGAIPAPLLTLLALLFFGAAVGKSAQLPLTAWLPDAMAGPTPVSALIHSATMVAAGVYLVLRLFPLFEAAPGALQTVLAIGAVTALFAALVATAQHDLKRILAWSTVSQLGEMMVALGLAGPVAAAFHLTTHAAFKSTLFLAVGAVEQQTNSRDVRDLGGLAGQLPVTAGAFAVAALALAGLPPFAGFWSEEKILEHAVSSGAQWGVLMVILIFLAGTYIGRAGAAVFLSWPDAPAPSANRPGIPTLAPMLILGLGALVLGVALRVPIERVLPFAPDQQPAGAWRWLAIGASALGLAFGGWRVRIAGPVPALGGFPQVLARGLESATRAPVRLAWYFSRSLQTVEHGLDRYTGGIGIGAITLARAAAGGERALYIAARATGGGLVRTADAIGATEAKGFGQGLDLFARSFSSLGGRLRVLQSGKLYLYTMGVLVWVLAAGVLLTLIWL